MMSSCVLQDAFGGLLGIDIDMLTDNSLELTNPAFNTLKLKVTPNDYSTPAEDPSISITSPADGATIDSSDFSVEFSVENFSVGSSEDIDGHVHILVDGAAGTPYGAYMVYSLDPIELTGVPDGDHSITLQLVDTSHQPFDPSIESSVNITVDTSVPNTAPEASFSWTADDLTVMFTNTSSDEDGDPLIYAWDFGDDGTSTEESPTHTYAAEGTYTVSLTVTDSNELSDAYSEDITVEELVEPPSGDPDFSVTINVTGGVGSYDLTIGFSPDATDGYDEGIDTYFPPAPPPPAFDAALTWGGDRYSTQILNGSIDDLVVHEYGVALAYGTDNLITVTWDNTGWSDLMSACVLQDAFGGLLGIDVDMLTGTSLTLTNPAFTNLLLKVTPAAGSTLSVDDSDVLPEVFALRQNYPNPFNPVTTLSYNLPEQSTVNIIIYDMLGRMITQLVSAKQEPGYRSVQWDATDMYGKSVSAGIYLYQIQAGEFVQTRKMVLLK
jgi:hypothetical protein